MSTFEIRFICNVCLSANVIDAPLSSGDTFSIYCSCGITHSLVYTNNAGGTTAGELSKNVLEYTFGQRFGQKVVAKDEVPIVDVKELMG